MDKIKVLFCTPYIQNDGVVFGGINIWGNSILNYYKSISSDVELVPVSFDRRFNVQEDTGALTRLLQGYKDYKNAIKRVLTIIGKHDVDVLHLCTSAQLSLFKDLYLLKKVKKKGVKTIIHFHLGRIPELKTLNNWEWKLILKVCGVADSVIVMDRKSYDVLKTEGLDNVYYVPNPLSLPIIEQIDKERHQIKRVSGKVLFVGHVIPSKGVNELAEACQKLKNVVLNFVGTVDDEDKKKLYDIVGNDTSKLVFRGGVPHEEVIREMLSCDVFALPSYTEGFPNVILEAMACGCPIVATKVGAIPEMLEEENGNQYGILVNPRSSESLYVALKTLLDSGTVKDNIGNNALIRVKKRYVIPNVWNQLEAIWKNNS